ncbi:MAG: hypothetical protein R3281_18885 [Balneolaceae bacterium]|nr:hypothetical protein [Balneolaceae bacterium]
MWPEYFIIAFTEQYPIFMFVITAAGIAVTVESVRLARAGSGRKGSKKILGAGLLALFTGLLVFPVESVQMMQALNTAGEIDPSVVMGGFYVAFVPLGCGFFWFLASMIGWLYLNSKVPDTADLQN